MNDPIKNTMRKTLSYWYVDGLIELATGLLLVLVGLSYFALAKLVPEAAARQVSSIGLPALILIGGLVSRKAVSSLKERLTYPRTGYVALIKARAGQKLWTIAAAITVSLGFVFISAQLKLDWLVYVAPAFLAAMMVASIGYTYGLRRFYVLAIYILLLGLPMALLRLNDRLNLALFLIGCGSGFIISGALTLRSYLQTTQPPLGEVE
jgi:hypothetical protein